MISTYQKYTLNFKFLAGTSRGVLSHKDSFFIKVSQEYPSKLYGIGESAPLKGLSMDDREDFESILAHHCNQLNESEWLPKSENEIFEWVNTHIDAGLPSIRFGFETALLDFFYHNNRTILQNNWSQQDFKPIEINGLVWMGEKEWMLEQLKSKINDGYSCIKIKIGAIDFQKEMELLAYIRKHYSADQITIRVDANGAFTEDDVFQKLTKLAEYEVHSIEQPVKQKQYTLMQQICVQSPVDIALDEDLIGVTALADQENLLEQVKPQYIILKPTLVGGISASRAWISLAEARNIGWWITSALESNVGLNAISQLCATYDTSLPQGLGTGQLYHNNFPSPLDIQHGHLHYLPNKAWDLSALAI